MNKWLLETNPNNTLTRQNPGRIFRCLTRILKLSMSSVCAQTVWLHLPQGTGKGSSDCEQYLEPSLALCVQFPAWRACPHPGTDSWTIQKPNASRKDKLWKRRWLIQKHLSTQSFRFTFTTVTVFLTAFLCQCKEPSLWPQPQHCDSGKGAQLHTKTAFSSPLKSSANIPNVPHCVTFMPGHFSECSPCWFMAQLWYSTTKHHGFLLPQVAE